MVDDEGKTIKRRKCVWCSLSHGHRCITTRCEVAIRLNGLGSDGLLRDCRILRNNGVTGDRIKIALIRFGEGAAEYLRKTYAPTVTLSGDYDALGNNIAHRNFQRSMEEQRIYEEQMLQRQQQYQEQALRDFRSLDPSALMHVLEPVRGRKHPAGAAAASSAEDSQAALQLQTMLQHGRGQSESAPAGPSSSTATATSAIARPSQHNQTAMRGTKDKLPRDSIPQMSHMQHQHHRFPQQSSTTITQQPNLPTQPQQQQQQQQQPMGFALEQPHLVQMVQPMMPYSQAIPPVETMVITGAVQPAPFVPGMSYYMPPPQQQPALQQMQQMQPPPPPQQQQQQPQQQQAQQQQAQQQPQQQQQQIQHAYQPIYQTALPQFAMPQQQQFAFAPQSIIGYSYNMMPQQPQHQPQQQPQHSLQQSSTSSSSQSDPSSQQQQQLPSPMPMPTAYPVALGIYPHLSAPSMQPQMHMAGLAQIQMQIQQIQQIQQAQQQQLMQQQQHNKQPQAPVSLPPLPSVIPPPGQHSPKAGNKRSVSEIEPELPPMTSDATMYASRSNPELRGSGVAEPPAKRARSPRPEPAPLPESPRITRASRTKPN